MKHYLRLALSLFLCMTLFLAAMPVYAASFTDIDGHWSLSYVEKAASWNIVTGYTDGTFRPENNVSCQEAMIMICKTLAQAGIEDVDGSFTANWTDLLSRLGFADWSAGFAAQLLEHKYALEKDFAGFAAAVPAQRQLIGAWFARAIGLPQAPLCSSSAFTDSSLVRNDFIGEIDALKRFGVMNGYTDGSLRPTGPVKRAEFATMCVNSLVILEDLANSAGKERLKDTLFLAYGNLNVSNAASREVQLTESGMNSLYRVPENAVILIDGVKSDFNALSSLSGKKLAVSCLYGFDSQLIIQTHSAVEKGTLVSMTAASDFSLLTIALSNNLSVNYVLETEEIPSGLEVGSQVSFISEGAHILELFVTSSER